LAALLDTSIAIHLRDETAGFGDQIAGLTSHAFLSAISRVELEGGVSAVPELASLRRAKLDLLLMNIDVLEFTDEMAEIYGRIVQQSGYSRRKIIDRMIAATALVHDLTLITANGDDFTDIDGLKLEVWKA
jgi:tRNA(fMet)-specific endonuclease VapC